ncbi:MAG: response regulator, partial [Candidatus Eisenbacteria bacterium]|nr:response regulator [Candidatus Eisenbacteria bacterium]
RAWLDRRRWSLVCVDVELPDASGSEFLRELVARHGIQTPLVALVRDADDMAVAREAGISRTLRKPFDREALEALLVRLGLAGRGAR